MHEKEAAKRKAEREGTDFDEEEYEEQSFGGRPDDAKVAGKEPATTEIADNSGRIRVDGKAAADSLNSLAAQALQQVGKGRRKGVCYVRLAPLYIA